MIELNHNVALYVPSTINGNTPAGGLQDTMIDYVAGEFSKLYGGASAIPLTGYWLSDAIGLVRENPVKVYAFCSDITPDDVIRLAEEIKGIMSQEAVLIELDGKAILV